MTGEGRRTSIQWTQLLLELVMVVVGILLALGIDSWWAGRQEHALEHDLLTQLSADLDRAEQQLEAELRLTEQATEAALHLVAAAHGQRQAPSDSLAKWLVRVSWWSDPVPTTASAQALVSSNTLHVIQDDALRSSVVTFLDQVAQLQVRIPRHEADLHDFLRSVDQLVNPLDRGVPLYKCRVAGRATRLAARSSGSGL